MSKLLNQFKHSTPGMGNDGGSLQSRSVLVKVKEIDRHKKDIDDIEAYFTCAITGKELEKPIVSCLLGKLYNRNALIQYLIEKKEGTKIVSDVASHIKSLKQVTMLNLENPRHYVCPVTNKTFGRGAFVYLQCGCVLAKQKYEQCPICGQTSLKSTTINPNQDELIKLTAKLFKKKRK